MHPPLPWLRWAGIHRNSTKTNKQTKIPLCHHHHSAQGVFVCTGRWTALLALPEQSPATSRGPSGVSTETQSETGKTKNKTLNRRSCCQQAGWQERRWQKKEHTLKQMMRFSLLTNPVSISFIFLIFIKSSTKPSLKYTLEVWSHNCPLETLEFSHI